MTSTTKSLDDEVNGYWKNYDIYIVDYDTKTFHVIDDKETGTVLIRRINPLPKGDKR